jgi:hypothetical protein
MLRVPAHGLEMTPFLVQWLKRWALACAVLLVPATANAQFSTNVTVGNNGVPTDRTEGPIEHDNRNAISFADCLKNDVLTFQVSMSSVAGGELQVWVSSSSNDCQATQSRNNADRICWLVHTSPAVNATFIPIELSSQAIISNNVASNTIVTPSQQECRESTFGNTTPQKLTLHFMIIDSAGALISNDALVSIDADLIGPAAPTNVKAGVGEERLVISWDQAAAEDRLGHRFYCAPAGTTTMQGDSGIDLDSGFDATDPDTGTGGTPSDASPTDGAGGVGGAGGSSATDGGLTDAGTPESGTGGNSRCPSPALIAGQRPDEKFRCGEVGLTATEGEATGLQNDVLYAVAIAGRDKLENAGPLSAVVCGTPKQVDDFFEVYRRAGGQGGGGFCAIGANPAYGAGILFGMAALASWVRRRRR